MGAQGSVEEGRKDGWRASGPLHGGLTGQLLDLLAGQVAVAEHAFDGIGSLFFHFAADVGFPAFGAGPFGFSMSILNLAVLEHSDASCW